MHENLIHPLRKDLLTNLIAILSRLGVHPEDR